MTTAIFDTLKASRDLKAAGVDARQAEAIVTTMAEAFDDAVATKANLAEVKADLKADIAAVKAELKADIAAVKADLTGIKADLMQEIAGLKADFKIFKFVFAPAVILLLLKLLSSPDRAATESASTKVKYNKKLSLLQNSDLHLAGHGFPPGSAGVPPAFLLRRCPSASRQVNRPTL